jgi:hypothetical protein
MTYEHGFGARGKRWPALKEKTSFMEISFHKGISMG